MLIFIWSDAIIVLQGKEREVIKMIKIKCPKCESREVEYIDSDHQWISVMDGEGCANGIYHCPKCKISFGAWADFKIEITECKIDWIENDEEYENE